MSFNADGEVFPPPPVRPEEFIQQFEIRKNGKAPLEEHIQRVEFRITVHEPPFKGSDFVALLDVSDSMVGDKLAQMKEAMLHLIQQLTHRDRLSIVQFASNVEIDILRPLQLVIDSCRMEVEDLIKGLQTKKVEANFQRESVLDQAISAGAEILDFSCMYPRHQDVHGIILMSGKHYDKDTYYGRSIYSYWFGDGQNTKDWRHAAVKCLNMLRRNDKITKQILTITEIKNESTIHKVSYDGDPESKMSQQSLGRNGSTTVKLDDNRYNHSVFVELLLSAANEERDVIVLVGCYKYNSGPDRFQKSFKINVWRTGEVLQAGHLEARPEVKAESDDGQILSIDGDLFWRINDDQVLFVPPNSMPMPYFPKPEQPTISGRVQALVRCNDKVSTGAKEHMVMLEFTGEEKLSRSPADIVAVLDVSSSMEGEKLAEMKRAMLFLMTKLSPLDRLSIVTYHDQAKMLYPLRPVTLRDKTKLENLINGMQAHIGSTNIDCGIRMGLDVLNHRKYIKGRHGAIMFMAGGRQSPLSNVWLNTLNGFHHRDVPIHTFGFGDEHDVEELSKIASDSGGGRYSDVRLGNLCVAFAKCLAGLLSVVAHDLTLFTRQTDGSWFETRRMRDLCMKECREVLLDGIPLDEGRSNKEILHFFYSYEFDGQKYESEDSTVSVSGLGELSAEDAVTEEMVLYAFDFVESAYLRHEHPEFELCGNISKEETAKRVREYLAQQLMRGPPEVLSQERLEKIIISKIKERIFLSSDLKSAQGGLAECMKIARYCGQVLQPDVELWDDLWADLEELHALTSYPDIYEKEGRAFAFSLLSSLETQRHTSRGHNIGRFMLFATPLVRQFLHEAANFDAKLP